MLSTRRCLVLLAMNKVKKRAKLFVSLCFFLPYCLAYAQTSPVSEKQSSVTEAISLPEGVTLLESVPFSDDRVMIPYQKYRLKNGLTLILSPDNSDPLVHVDVTYHVGSAREVIGKSGYAHFFEHMMFEGSEHVAPQEHFKLISQAGGQANGSTGRDITHYYETLPANELEKALWLEADRMGFLVNAITKEKFENQRATVINERMQRYDNRPYGLMWEKMGEALYPLTHPYSWQTIGYTEDLNRAKIDDLKAFFLRWYGPNNAVLTIGGDFDTQQVLIWVHKYFATIPKGPEVKSPAKQPVSLMSDRYITYEDNIAQPMILMAYPTTYMGDEAEAGLNMLAGILGQGKNSLLYQALVKTGKAVNAGAFHRCSELSCTLYLYANLNPTKGYHLSKIRQEILQSQDHFEHLPVDLSRLDEIKGRAEAGAIYSLESVEGKTTQLAMNQTFFNRPDRLQSELDDIQAVSTKKLKQLFNEFIYKKPCVTLSIVPEGKPELEAALPNFKPAARVISEDSEQKKKIWVNRSVQDDFDRSQIPDSAEAVRAKLPKLWKGTLSNHIRVLGTTHREAPTISLNIYLPAGHLYERLSKVGVAKLTAELMNASSRVSTEEALQSELDKLGSSVSFSVGTYTTVVQLSTLKKNLTQSLAILKERLFKPAFKQEEFNRLKTQTFESIKSAKNRPDWLASRAVKRVLFGKSNILAEPLDGTLKTIKTVTLTDVKNFYNDHYQPEGAYVTVVGDIEKEALFGALKFLGDWKGKKAASLPAMAKLPHYNDSNIWLVDKPDAAQSVIHFVRQGLTYTPLGEFYQLRLLNFSFSDNINSRLMQNLREDKGFTYGIYGSIVGNKTYGYIDIATDVKGNSTLASVREIIKELNKMALSGPTEEEIYFMKKSVGEKEALLYETPMQKAGLLSQIMFYGLEDNFIRQQKVLTEAVTQKQLGKLAQKWYQAKDYQIVIVGDKDKLAPKLKTLNLPLQILSF